jgi:hypothetical protein
MERGIGALPLRTRCWLHLRVHFSTTSPCSAGTAPPELTWDIRSESLTRSGCTSSTALRNGSESFTACGHGQAGTSAQSGTHTAPTTLQLVELHEEVMPGPRTDGPPPLSHTSLTHTHTLRWPTVPHARLSLSTIRSRGSTSPAHVGSTCKSHVITCCYFHHEAICALRGKRQPGDTHRHKVETALPMPSSRAHPSLKLVELSMQLGEEGSNPWHHVLSLHRIVLWEGGILLWWGGGGRQIDVGDKREQQRESGGRVGN